MENKISQELRKIAKNVLADSEQDDWSEISFKVKGDTEMFKKLLRQCEYNGNVGHSFEIITDPDGDTGDKRSFGFDGDGADCISDIKVNGKLLSKKFAW